MKDRLKVLRWKKWSWSLNARTRNPPNIIPWLTKEQRPSKSSLTNLVSCLWIYFVGVTWWFPLRKRDSSQSSKPFFNGTNLIYFSLNFTSNANVPITALEKHTLLSSKKLLQCLSFIPCVYLSKLTTILCEVRINFSSLYPTRLLTSNMLENGVLLRCAWFIVTTKFSVSKVFGVLKSMNSSLFVKA